MKNNKSKWKIDTSTGREIEYKEKKNGLKKFHNKEDARDFAGAKRSIDDKDKNDGEDNDEMRKLEKRNNKEYSKMFDDDDMSTEYDGSYVRKGVSGNRARHNDKQIEDNSGDHYYTGKTSVNTNKNGVPEEIEVDNAKFSRAKDAKKYSDMAGRGKTSRANRFLKKKESNDKARDLTSEREKNRRK